MLTLKPFPTVTVLVIALGLLVASGPSARAQKTTDSFQSTTFSSDSISLISAIAAYRDDVRQAALLVSQNPQVLSRLAQEQVRSQQGFDTLIQSYGQTKKGWFYDIARFPSVLHGLALLPRNHANKAQGRAIKQTLPAESQRSAWKLYRHHHIELVRADSINQQAEQRFDSLVTPLATPTQKAFRQLLTLPDLLELLTQQIAQATRLGQTYLADSAGTVQQLVSLHDSLLAQNRRELADYQRELNQDPLAQQELLLASQAYAQANGRPMNMNPDPAWSDSLVYYQNPYSFWFGCPSWLSVSFWSAAWYGSGYSYGPGGNLMVFSLPSPGFTTWFFRGAFRTYPHLCDHFNAYYDRIMNRPRFWTPRNSTFLLAAQRRFSPRYTDWSGHRNWLTSPRRYGHTFNTTGSNVSIWTSSPRRNYSRPSRSYSTRSWSWGHSSTHHSSSHHSGSFHSSGSHTHSSGGSSHGHGPR